MTDDVTEWADGRRPAADLVTPMAVRVAATLRLADHVVASPRTAREMATAAQADRTRWRVAAAVEGRRAGPLNRLCPTFRRR